MSGVSAGLLNRRVTLQRPSGEDGSYADVATIWVGIRAAQGQELLRFGTPLATGAYVVTAYYRSDVRASWRLVVIDESPQRSLQIASYADPEGDRRTMRIYVTEEL